MHSADELLQTITVLYVEDDEHTAEAMAKYIRKRVKNLYVTNNGKCGLDLFQSKKIDLIITDIKMPYMNGIDMVKAIKKIKKDVKVIFISAYHEDNLFLKAIEVGADGFLTKPVSAANGLLPLMHKATIEIVKDRMITEYTKTLKLILDYVDSMVIVSDGEKLFNANKSFLQFFGMNEFKQFTQQYPRLYTIFTPLDSFISGKNWLDDATKKTPAKVKIKDNTFLIQIKPIDTPSSVAKFVVNFTDITKLENEQFQLMQNASKDVPTGLINREVFQKLYKKELRHMAQTKIRFSIVSIKVLNLDAINLQSSFTQGDKVLVALAKVISDHFQNNDIITRWGGGSFLVLYASDNEKKINECVSKLNTTVRSCQFEVDIDVDIAIQYKKINSNVDFETMIEEFKK